MATTKRVFDAYDNWPLPPVYVWHSLFRERCFPKSSTKETAYWAILSLPHAYFHGFTMLKKCGLSDLVVLRPKGRAAPQPIRLEVVDVEDNREAVGPRFDLDPSLRCGQQLDLRTAHHA